MALSLGLLIAAAALLPTAGASAAGPAPGRPATPARVAPADRPTIVVLVIDDLPEIGLRLWRRMPTIRRTFLQHAVRFTGYVGNDPLCCPGRATLFTGQRSRDHGVIENDAKLFDPRVSIATELRAKGYRTGLFGKYLNNQENLKDKVPDGWDRVVFGGGYYARDWWDQGVRVERGTAPEEYSTDYVRRRAVSWLRQVPPSEPVLLWLTPFAIHSGSNEYGLSFPFTPIPAPRHRGDPRCTDAGLWQTPAHAAVGVPGQPSFLDGSDPATWAAGWPLVPACETLLAVDDLLAAVRRTLEAQGRHNVLFVLTADNGMSWGRYGWAPKRVPWSVPIPLFVRWTRGLGDRPRTVAATTTATDIAPTLCAVAGCVMGPFPNGRPVSGRSLLPLLTGRVRTLDRTAIPTEHLVPGVDDRVSPPWKAVRTTEHARIGRWSYTVYPDGERTLYDLDADPWELRNVVADPAYRPVFEALNLAWWRLHYPRPPQPFRPIGWWPARPGGCRYDERRCPDGEAALAVGTRGALAHPWDPPVRWTVQLPE